MLSRRATSRSSRSGSTARSGGTRARGTLLASAARSSSRRPSPLGYVALAQGFGDFSRSFFVVDALFAGAIARLALRGARVIGARAEADRTAAQVADRGCGPHGPQPAARAARDPGRAGRRLRRRQPAAAPAARSTACRSLGGTHEIAGAARAPEPDIVFVTIPDAPRERLDAVVAACAEAGVVCRFVRRETDLEPHVVLRRLRGRVTTSVAPPPRAASAMLVDRFIAACLRDRRVSSSRSTSGRLAVRKTPRVFTDELQWAQLSRGIAETGHAARRGEPGRSSRSTRT